MINKTKIRNLLITIGIIILSAALGGVLAGDSPRELFTEINQPWFALPLWAWMIVAVLYYLIMGVILYRLLNDPPGKSRIILLCTLLLILLYNEIWNYILFVNGNMKFTFFSLLPFVGIVIFLFYKLRKYNKGLSYILIPYLIWLVYDIVWAYNLWALN